MQHAADRHGWTRFVAMQNHYNLVYREEEREMIPLCIADGIGLIPWSPSARGFLAGNRTTDRSGDTSRARTDAFAHDLYFRPEDFTIVDWNRHCQMTATPNHTLQRTRPSARGCKRSPARAGFADLGPLSCSC